ncbi:MAG: anthranilate phosphoribosyltransferase [Pirellulaceae bacterium]
MTQAETDTDQILLLVHQLVAGQSLTADQSHQFFSAVVNGQMDEVWLSAAVSTIKMRGQTADELAGAASALLASATPFPSPDYPFADVVGTGGDGHNTINLSTIAAITAATCGARIVKHGNRSISSASGSFDLLEAVGVNFDIDPEAARQQVDTRGLCFLFAPRYHAGMRHAGHVRKALKMRTIFNLLGPLVNPARPPLMLLGVADPGLLDQIAEVLAMLQCQSALVVHGSGVDEVAIHGPTSVVELQDGKIDKYEVAPADFDAPKWQLDQLTCNDTAESHRRSIAVLEGQGSDAENAAVAVNVAMVLRLFGHNDLKQNYATAIESLQRSAPGELIRKLVAEQA